METKSRVSDEVVVLVRDESGVPTHIVKKGDGVVKVEIFLLKPAGFTDVEQMLKTLAGEDSKSNVKPL